MVAPVLSREVLVLAALVACQLLYSQVYPAIKPLLPEAWLNGDEGASLGPTAVPPAVPPESTSGPESAEDQPPSAGSAAHEDPARGRDESAQEAAPRDGASDRSDEPWPLLEEGGKKRRAELRRKPKFKVGQVVRDKVLLLRGVVAGWDAPCKGPLWWRSKRLVVESWAQDPCYGLLVDLRDMGELSSGEDSPRSELNFTHYAPEATLESLSREAAAGSPIVNPLLHLSFRFFDEGRYIPDQSILEAYPDDVSSHYSDLDAVETNEKGQPLLRIADFGRFIAHGAPVPVIRKGMFLVATEGVRGDIFSRSAILVLEHSDNSGTLGVIANSRKSLGKLTEAGRAMLDRAEAVLAGMQSREQAPEAQLQGLAAEISAGRQILKFMQLPGVDVRVGGPVGLQEFPLGGENHIVLHPFAEPKALRKASKLALSGSGTRDNPDLFYVRLGALKKKELDMLVARTREEGSRAILFVGNSAWGPLQLAGEIRGSLGGGSSWGWVPASSREVLQHDQSGTWSNLNSSKAIQFLESVE